MSAWLIGIVGVVSLGVLIEIILPEGENSKYIRGIFSIIVIFVIVSPLPKLLKGDLIKDMVSGGESAKIEIDEDYYKATVEGIHKTMQDGLKDRLSESGYGGVEFQIEFDENYAYAIDKVIVTGGISSDKEWEDIKKIIVGYVGRATVERRSK